MTIFNKPHVGLNTFVHCLTLDFQVMAIPARMIQYYRNHFFQTPNGHWGTTLTSAQVQEFMKEAEILFQY